MFDDRALRFRSLTLANGLEETLDDPGALQGAFKIRVAKREGFRREASTLVDRRYTDRGYQTKAAEPDPHLFTFVAYDEGELVGTVSIRIDSEKGLSADELYKDELDVLRQGGCKLCEFTRLAVDVVNVSKPVLAGLFHTAYLYAGEVHACTFVVIEVNPRHVPFYRRALKFEPIGPERTNKRVEAPAVLLCASVRRDCRRAQEVRRPARARRDGTLALSVGVLAEGGGRDPRSAEGAGSEEVRGLKRRGRSGVRAASGNPA